MQICESGYTRRVTALDPDRVARQFLVALRGPRSQVQWSRRLGYRSNVAYAWESGRRQPTAAEVLRACARAGIDLEAALTRFYGSRPGWLPADPTSPAAVALLLDDLRGTTSVTAVAAAAGVSRWQVTRWLQGDTEPRFADFLRVLEAVSLRLVDFLACLVPPDAVPDLREPWARLQLRREGARRYPWTQALLRVLELEGYRTAPRHDDAWVAGALGLPVEHVRECLSFMSELGQLAWTGTHWAPAATMVDTRLSAEVGRELKAHWTRVAAERLTAGAEGQFSYNVFAVSRADFERIRELHLDYFRALRAVVAESEPAEVVAVVNVQLFPLSRE